MDEKKGNIIPVNKQCNVTVADKKLLKQIDLRQRITRLWFWKAIVGTIWVFFTWVLYMAVMVIVDVVPVETRYNSHVEGVTLFMGLIILISYSYWLGRLWFYTNEIYDIPSEWVD